MSRGETSAQLQMRRRAEFRGQSWAAFCEQASKETSYLDSDGRYLPAKSLVILGGRFKNGKTYTAGWLAAKVLAADGVVTFVEEEGAQSTLRQRLEPFLRSQESVLLRVLHRTGLKLSNDDAVGDFIHAQRFEPDGTPRRTPDLVVLDALYVLAGCSVADMEQMARALTNLQRIIAELGCTVLLLHHVRKGIPGEKKMDITDADELMGTGTLGASADLVIIANKLPDEHQQKGSLALHITCPTNGSRLAEPFGKRLVVFTNIAELATISDEPAPDADRADEGDPGLVEALRAALAGRGPGEEVSIHALGEAAGLKVRTQALSKAGAQLVKEGLLVAPAKRGLPYRMPQERTAPSEPEPREGKLTMSVEVSDPVENGRTASAAELFPSSGS